MVTSSIPYQGASRVKANGIEIVYDTFGESSRPPLLLISGLGMQLIGWDDEFCKALAARGYWVIRFDNRDVGLSTRFDEAGVPDLNALMVARARGEAYSTPYTLNDMMDDAIGLLDALNITAAHLVGISMGGMIAQLLAIRYPKRVCTLTSLMSSTGEGGAPRAKPEVLWVLTTPSPTERNAYVEHNVRLWRTLYGPGFPFDEVRIRERAIRYFERSVNPAGTARQLAAIMASDTRKRALKSITIPTLVIHGTADPLIPVEYGIETADSIPGAKLVLIEGLGHSLPPEAAPQIIDAIVQHARD